MVIRPLPLESFPVLFTNRTGIVIFGSIVPRVNIVRIAIEIPGVTRGFSAVTNGFDDPRRQHEVILR